MFRSWVAITKKNTYFGPVVSQRTPPMSGAINETIPLKSPRMPYVLPSREGGTSSAVIAPLMTEVTSENPCKMAEMIRIVELG